MKPRPCVIILEGPDGSGKTTLAHQLSQLTDYEWLHFIAPAQGVSFDDVCRKHIREIATTGKSVILDRFHLSERVYGPIARNVDTMSETFEQVLWDTVQPLVILCLPPYDVAYQNWARRNAERAEMITKREQYNAVYRAYQKIRTTLPILQYDYTRDRTADMYNRLTAIGFSPA